jgi:hypothetical protein
MKTPEQEKTDTRVSFLQYLNTFLLTVCLVLLGIGVNQMVVFNEKYTTTITKQNTMELQQTYQREWTIERDKLNTEEHRKFDQRIEAVEIELRQKKKSN